MKKSGSTCPVNFQAGDATILFFLFGNFLGNRGALHLEFVSPEEYRRPGFWFPAARGNHSFSDSDSDTTVAPRSSVVTEAEANSNAITKPEQEPETSSRKPTEPIARPEPQPDEGSPKEPDKNAEPVPESSKPPNQYVESQASPDPTLNNNWATGLANGANPLPEPSPEPEPGPNEKQETQDEAHPSAAAQVVDIRSVLKYSFLNLVVVALAHPMFVL